MRKDPLSDGAGTLKCSFCPSPSEVTPEEFMPYLSGLPSSNPGLSHSLLPCTCSIQARAGRAEPKRRHGGTFTDTIQSVARGGAVGGLVALQTRKESDPLNQKMTLCLSSLV